MLCIAVCDKCILFQINSNKHKERISGTENRYCSSRLFPLNFYFPFRVCIKQLPLFAMNLDLLLIYRYY
jgi:hypothetical protein